MVHREPFDAVDGLVNQITIASQVLEQFAVPDTAVTVGSECSGKTKGVYRRHDAGHGLAKSPAESRVGDHGKGTAEAGNVEGFARGKEGDGAGRDLRGEAGDGDVFFVCVQNQAGVNLVGADEEPVTQAQLGDGAEFFPVECPSHRVMGIAEEEKSGSAGDCSLKVGEIENPSVIVLHEMGCHQIAKGIAWCAEEGGVHRNGAENLISVVTDSPAGQVEAG